VVQECRRENAREAEREAKRTHRYPAGNQIDLVEDVDDLLLALLLGEVALNALAAGAEGISGIEDVQDDVGRIDDLTTGMRSC
jgi:hypothetical protein